ncbi:hypothetical protein HanIR_Chr05g0210201 [Helianthus annuus]|nr:hypothetical protein HanIR_Chr05g0210201 [Helianthus annuus]
MGSVKHLLFITTLVILLTNINATSRLERGFVHLAVGPSQPPDSSLSGAHSNLDTMRNEGAPYPGTHGHHKTNKSKAGGDVIIAGYVMAFVVVVLLYIRVTRKTTNVHS